MKILSLDWDYFFDATPEERKELFYDGEDEDIPMNKLNIDWVVRYVNSIHHRSQGNSKDLYSICSNKGLINYILNLVDKTDYYFISSDSHKFLGEYILTHYENTPPNDLKIVNVDFHSDLYVNGEELDCGNWGNKVMEAFSNSKFLWVARETNKDLSFNKLPYRDRISYTTNISDVRDKFDVVFLCRSSVWSPPHLDHEFMRFHDKLKSMSSENACADLPIRWNSVSRDITNIINVLPERIL